MIAWQPPPRPDWVEHLNAHGTAVGGADQLVSLEPEELLAQARASTGRGDFGVPGWHRHYEILLRALQEESKLHLAGRLIARSEVLRSLRNRLELTALWARRPEVLEASLPAPVFIVGSPRTGTSLLHELLALDPATRTPAMWEMLHPAAAVADEAMRPLGDAQVRLWPDLQPEYAAMHHNAGDLPNECIFITMNEFLSDHWGGCHVVPSYSVHLLKADHRDAYRFHGRVLRTLQLRGSAQRWVLKAPSHLSQLPALFDVYPDARVIQTHRDPLRSLPSALSLMGTLKWMRCDEVDLAPLAAVLPRGFAASFQAEIAQRADGTLPDERFVDIGYHDLVADPVAAVAGIYARLEWEFSPAHAERIARYLAGQSRERRRPHVYSLGEMGLDAAAERERFAFYCERFGVPTEGA